MSTCQVTSLLVAVCLMSTCQVTSLQLPVCLMSTCQVTCLQLPVCLMSTCQVTCLQLPVCLMNACQVTCLQLPVALVSICLISSCPTGKCLIELLSNLPCDEQLSNCQLPNCQSRNGPTGNYSSSSCSAAAFQLLLYASCPEQCSCQGNIVTMSSCKIVCMECSCLKGIQNNLLLLMVTFPFCMQHLVGRVVLRSVPL